ncbi:hypothetical protein FUA23_08620 [Neolewinella aurantiaca]|uniref:Uncharacterized protein n=1 Tax=Neolewinella aurantiaca TaxID=2602767 RepID=A0A5C7FJG9_9BACT|nr:hypothetical protein [Neolewinella aurantiaca]TXF90005.1 hypothetical protein FUA23_08620 [Neolewinella aurantiaca]
MIQEATIERILARLESGTDDFNVEIQDFAEAQPNLAAYLTNEDSETLNEDERTLLLFGAIVIYQSVMDERIVRDVISEEIIGQLEEDNYALMPAKGAFRDRLTPFFEESEEEELLAFAEDLIVAEADEDGITKEAREPMFIALKTVIDCLLI